jgi:hypothetical protein
MGISVAVLEGASSAGSEKALSIPSQPASLSPPESEFVSCDRVAADRGGQR